MREVKSGPFQESSKTEPTKKIEEHWIGVPAVAINPGEHRIAAIRPQVVFKARRLVLPRPYPSLRIINLNVGKNSQLVTETAVPLNAFLQPPEIDELIKRLSVDGFSDPALGSELLAELRAYRNNLGSIDTCQIGMLIEITLENVGQEPLIFQGAMLYGDSVVTIP